MDTNTLNFQAIAARIRPHQHEKCPRCNSMNTKFCYYNNYSLTQPRHYCKACRRYWTQGGICRNIPIGGSTYRRNKRTRAACPRRPLVPIDSTFARRDRGSTSAGSITLYDGRTVGNIIPSMGINFPNEFDFRVDNFGHNMSTFGPIPLLSYNNNIVNVYKNVAPGYGNFLPSPPLIIGADAWHPEGLFANINQNDNMFLRGFNGVSGSRYYDRSGSSGPPLLVSNDIDIINDQWLEDLPDYTPPRPQPPPTSA